MLHRISSFNISFRTTTRIVLASYFEMNYSGNLLTNYTGDITSADNTCNSKKLNYN